MTDRKTCIRCNRAIDRYARLCVYCNWDQSETVPPAPESINAAPAYVPPPDNRVRNRLLGIGALVALVIVAFIVGTFIHGFEPSEAKAAPNKEVASGPTQVAPAHKSDVTLVPVTDGNAAPMVEQPITSAPPQAPGQQPNDATALPSDQYAAVAAKAKAQQQKKKDLVDPRSLRGNAYENDQQPPKRETEHAATLAPVRTEAFPEYKPVPSIHVDHDTVARLAVTVGPDGHVKDIDVIDPVPGGTGELIQSVQNWRFRPATENGTPVSARVNVTITLRSNG